MVAKYGFAISAGEWQDDVHAAGVALTLNDGTGPYAFNCGAPAFRFTEDRLLNDIGPRLVAMVRKIEAALGGTAIAAHQDEPTNPTTRKQNQEGKLRVSSRGSDSIRHREASPMLMLAARVQGRSK